MTESEPIPLSWSFDENDGGSIAHLTGILFPLPGDRLDNKKFMAVRQSIAAPSSDGGLSRDFVR
jgi:hypothetical protein